MQMQMQMQMQVVGILIQSLMVQLDLTLKSPQTGEG